MSLDLSTSLSPARPLESADAMEERLREIGAARYHDRHPFHHMLHGGELTKGQVQAWALNRYYYQCTIPVKDAVVISRFRDRATRIEWRHRLEDHDGAEGGRGRDRPLADPDGRAGARPGLCGIDRGHPARHPLCGRGLRPFRPRPLAARGHRLPA